jgi:ketosteroid isomerase-like protein
MLLILALVFSQIEHPVQDPAAIVRSYLKAMQALDAERMHRHLAADYTLVDTNGQERAYNPALAFPICEWERGMNTRWSYRILGVNQNQVSIILT